MTSRDGASTALSGFNVFGSERSDTTSRPPGCPISPATGSASTVDAPCPGTAGFALGTTKNARRDARENASKNTGKDATENNRPAPSRQPPRHPPPKFAPFPPIIDPPPPP